MKTHDAELQRIRNLLRENPKGIKVSRIAQALGMNRNAAAKYLEILLITGQVEVIEHGMSRIFILSRRTGIPTMLDGSRDMILVLDSSLKIARVNGNYLKFAGRKEEDLLGKRIDTDLLPVVGSSPVRDRIHLARFGEDARTEIREAGKDGREYYFEVRLTPVVFNDGKRGITIIMSNITDEKKLQETAAAENQNLVEGVLSCIDDAVILLDAGSGTISFLNPAACRMFGYGRDACTGKDAGFLAGTAGVIPGNSARIEADLRRDGYFEAGSRMRRSDGGEFPASLQLRPVFNGRGELKNIVLIVRDITARTENRQEVASRVRVPALIPPNFVSAGTIFDGVI